MTLDYDKEDNPDYNPNLTKSINELGGMEALVTSVSGRNLWAIMKFFRVLPNDPLLKSLTFSQREFIIQSMNQDAIEAKNASEGKKTDQKIVDRSFTKKFYSNDDVDLLEDGDDLDEIYRQSLIAKKKVDAKYGIDEDYDQVIKERIQQALDDKQRELSQTKQQVAQNWRDLLNLDQYHSDND